MEDLGSILDLQRLDFGAFSKLARSSRPTRSKTRRFLKNNKKHHRVASKSRFGLCAHDSQIVQKTSRTRFSTKSRGRTLSNDGFSTFQASKWSPRALRGVSWRSLARSWGALGRSWSALGPLLGRSGTLLGRSWTLLARSWTLMARSWTLLGVSCSTKINPQELRRVILAVLGSILDGF